MKRLFLFAVLFVVLPSMGFCADNLLDLVNKADVIVVGKILSAQPDDPKQPDKKQNVTVQVERTFKGLPSEKLSVVYNGKADEMKAEQKYVWLLTRNSENPNQMLALQSACRQDADKAEDIKNAVIKNLPKVLDPKASSWKGAWCGFDTKVERVIETQEDWDGVWKKLQEGLDKISDAPKVDFKTNAVAIAAWGNNTDGGDQFLEISNVFPVKDKDYQLQVMRTMTFAQNPQLIPEVIWRPFHVKILSRANDLTARKNIPANWIKHELLVTFNASASEEDINKTLLGIGQRVNTIDLTTSKIVLIKLSPDAKASEEAQQKDVCEKISILLKNPAITNVEFNVTYKLAPPEKKDDKAEKEVDKNGIGDLKLEPYKDNDEENKESDANEDK